MVCQQIEKGTDPRPFSLTYIAQPHNLLGDGFIGRRARDIYANHTDVRVQPRGRARAHVRVEFGNQSIEKRDGDGAFIRAAPRERLRITNLGSNVAEILLFDIDLQ
jgi:hypothetical protein